MTAETILSRLEGVKPIGAGKWIARCPAHDDKSPSLAIRETSDGRVLLHCFAGCPVEHVVACAGVRMSDLFPPRLIDHRVKRERVPFPAEQVLACLQTEALVVLVAAEDAEKGAMLSPSDHKRLTLAAQRIHGATKVRAR